MPVIAMKVAKAQMHPNAEALRLYVMEAPGYEPVDIIANLSNIYEEGDTVAIALPNSLLKDGTLIKPSKLRGVVSYGMALGKVSEPVGCDLSLTYCQPQLSTSARLLAWPSIELLHNVRRSLEITQQTPQITYRAKVKLDGTNGGVQVFSDGTVVAQSRNLIITPEDDNLGFAAWVLKNIDYFKQLASQEHLTLFGEWCGKGIQKRSAISTIDRRIFAIFGVQYGGKNSHVEELVINPEEIKKILPHHEDIFVLPYYGEAVTLDFGDPQQLQTAVKQLNQMVENVEESDPWVKEIFKVEGIGEGLVMYPEADKRVKKLEYSELIFKAKGEKHQVVKSAQPVEIDPQVAQNIDEFLAMFLTENRLQQGVTEACKGEYDVKKMGDFLKWIATDVLKESQGELQASNLTAKEIIKPLNNAAKQWYMSKAKS